MEDEIDKWQKLVAASAAEFNQIVVDTFQAIKGTGDKAEAQRLVEQCYSSAEEYENNLNGLLKVMNREPVKYAEEINRIYKHKVLRKQGLETLSSILKESADDP